MRQVSTVVMVVSMVAPATVVLISRVTKILADQSLTVTERMKCEGGVDGLAWWSHATKHGGAEREILDIGFDR